jgi:transcriptional regulator with XRE-family HTH domain
MIDNEIILRIAQKIKAIRTESRLTIQELSDRSAISKGLLSKIENSRTIPSLPVFVSLLQSLNTSPKEFFEDMTLLNGKSYLHIKKSNYLEIEKEDRPGFQYQHILSQNVSITNFEAVLLSIDPGTHGKPTVTDGYEFKYLLSGNCEYHIGETILQLEEGDSLYFDASKPHMPINKSRKPAMMLVLYFLRGR